MRIWMVGLTILALSLSACAQVTPDPIEEPKPSDTPVTGTPVTGEPLPAETQPVFEPANPDSTAVSPGRPGETPAANPYAPQPGDVNLELGGVFISEKGLLTLESFPPQYMLAFSGDLPTPCNDLRVKVGAPDAGGQIVVEAYSVIDNTMACIQVLEPFSVSIPLGSFADGKYTVLLNGEVVGEIGQ